MSDERRNHVVSYQSHIPGGRAIRRSFFLLIFVGMLSASLLVADLWEGRLDGHHNPRLWFFMDSAVHWKGYLGIALRAYQSYAAIACFLLLIAEFVRQIARRREPTIPNQIRGIQLAFWLVLFGYVAFVIVLPRLDN